MRILLVGYGEMGKALVGSWLKSNLSLKLTVINPAGRPLNAPDNVTFLSSPNSSLLENPPDSVVMAVKPQVMGQVLESYRFLSQKKTLFLSVAAGLKSLFYREILGPYTPFIRIMPNLPIKVGESMSVGFAEGSVTDQQRAIAETLFSCLGRLFWVEDEEDIERATAISGSGPGYLFLMIQAMVEAAESVGLSKEVALKLVKQTFNGTAALIKSYPEVEPKEWIASVASPGGTTEAALKRLDPELKKIVEKGVLAAYQKVKDLSQ